MRMSSESVFKHGSFSCGTIRVSHDCPVCAVRSETHDGRVIRRASGHKFEAIKCERKKESTESHEMEVFTCKIVD